MEQRVYSVSILCAEYRTRARTVNILFIQRVCEFTFFLPCFAAVCTTVEWQIYRNSRSNSEYLGWKEVTWHRAIPTSRVIRHGKICSLGSIFLARVDFFFAPRLAWKRETRKWRNFRVFFFETRSESIGIRRDIDFVLCAEPLKIFVVVVHSLGRCFEQNIYAYYTCGARSRVRYKLMSKLIN